MFERLSFERRDGLALVGLNRPSKLNAFDEQMFTDIVKVQKLIRKDKLLRAVIIYGKGNDFSSGLDIKSVMSNQMAMLRIFLKITPWHSNLAQEVSVGWRKLSIPVIMAIHGRCWGAGMQLALGGDFRFIHPKSSLAIMESRWGLIPDMGGSLALREIMGIEKAMEYTMTSREIKAAEALESGLVSRVVDEPLQEALNFAKQIAEKSPDSVAATKRLYQYAWHHNDRALLAREWILQWRMLLGKNRTIAIQKAMGKGEGRAYQPRAL